MLFTYMCDSDVVRLYVCVRVVVYLLSLIYVMFGTFEVTSSISPNVALTAESGGIIHFPVSFDGVLDAPFTARNSHVIIDGNLTLTWLITEYVRLVIRIIYFCWQLHVYCEFHGEA